jgi:DNA-binding NarL/FixJ family response regulator
MEDVTAVSAAGLAALPAAPLALQMRRATGSVVGRPAELAAVRQELEAAKKGQLAALTFEGEPGIGKSRLLLAGMHLATGEGFVPIAVTADEELRGPFLLARSIFASVEAQEAADGVAADAFRRVVDAMSGRDEPGLEGLAPDQKLLRVLDLAAVALRTLAMQQPVALILDDLQWADDDSVRLLRYVIRAAADAPLFMALAVRRDELALATEATALLADMERMGLVRRLTLTRLTQAETATMLKQVLGGDVEVSSAATMHAQAEGVPFIVEELARTYRTNGLVQQIDGVWTLGRNAERLVPSAVRTLIQRRAGRLPDDSRAVLSEAAVLGRHFSLKDLHMIRLRLDEESDMDALADALAPAVSAGLLVELGDESPADYSFTHEQVREFSAGALTAPRRRATHAPIVDLLTGDGEPPRESLPLLARHALAAGDPERAARFSIEATRAALEARAPEEALRLVELALPVTSAAQDRVKLLTARDEALDMLRRPEDRLEGLAELAALAEALGDSHLELEAILRRAAALRLSGEEDRAAQLAAEVRGTAAERSDRRAELAACLELGQALVRTPLGEGFSLPKESDADAAEEAFRRACQLAEQLGDVHALAAATRELGVIEVARARIFFVDLIRQGAHLPLLQRIFDGEDRDAVIAELPVAPHLQRATARFQEAIELFDQVGDRRGLMSSIISLAYIHVGLDVHIDGPIQRIEEIRRLATQLSSLSRQSDKVRDEVQMLYGTHVFARAKGVPDLALSRGMEASEKARDLGDRVLEFPATVGVVLAHLDLCDVEEAERWLDRVAAIAAAAPTPLRARQLEVLRGMARAAARDAMGMRHHLERAVELATEQGRPAARCETLARLALESVRLGVDLEDEELLALAERSALDAREITTLLPGHPLWGAQADAALARLLLARGDVPAAAEAGRSAFAALEAASLDDFNLEIVVPAARAILAGGAELEQQMVRLHLGMLLQMVARRVVAEDVRVAWFRSPMGRELSELAGPLESASVPDSPGPDGAGVVVEPEDRELLRLLVDGMTNDEIGAHLGVSVDEVTSKLAGLYARTGMSSRAEATTFAFRERVV